MYKVTIEEVVGEVRKITTLETDDVELVKLILQREIVVEIDSDEPNRNISDEWRKLQDIFKEAQERKQAPRPFGEPYVSPFTTPGSPYPGKPYDPYNPFVVTC